MTTPRSISTWPRLMRVDVLCEYCGVSENTIRKDVRQGRLPEPVIQERGRVQWDRRKVDEYIDRIANPGALRGWD